MALLGVVVAGGRSTRMGTDKADLEVDGVTMLERVHAALSRVAGAVVVSGSVRGGYRCWPDQAPATGPLTALVTVLERMSQDRALLVAVDHPFVSADTLTRLAGIDSDLPVVPVDEDGVRQVTCAVYPRGLAPVAREEAEAGGSIQSLLDRVSFTPVPPGMWRAWGEDGRSWFSVDTPADLQAARTRFGA